MSISALPPSSAHLLRSSSSLPDPLSVVKELVDNSIDAGATSIEITVAPNTVDKVQVRDNGCGIQVDDFKSLGHRSHTSKLRNFDELHLKGGGTLGFRGEALASANYLATIKITTRTAQDPIASLLLLNTKSGGISRQQPVSAPVGTTVQALNLFQTFPVRKQNAIKVSRKTLGDIRRLLEGYAITLPHIRLSFKVPGSSIQPWVYTPCSAPSTREAITQVFGNTLTTQLVAVSSDSHAGGTSTEVQSKKLRIVASLPKPDSDANIIKGKGAFISVDSRPISSSRSTGKKLVAIFRSSISAVLNSHDKSRAPSNAFMQLSIQCSPGSYDPNVTPSKDELLFVDEPAVLSCFQNLCDSVYTKNVLGDKELQHKLVASENSLSPLPWASKTVETRLRDGVRLDGMEKELLLTDQELVTSLNDEPERVLGGTDVSRSGERGSPDSPKKTSRSENLDGTRGPKKAPVVREMMRTRLTVNLSRRETASTDLDSTEELVPVHVTPRRAATPPVDELQSNPRRRGLASNRRFGNIDDYFRPSRDEPIQIATDETATPAIPHTRSYLTSASHHRRLPLKELSESLLNLFREYEEDDYEDESDDESASDLSFAGPNAVPSPHTSPRREAPSFLSQPFRPLLGQQSIRNSMPDLQLTLPANLQTPPSSDPTGADNSTRRDSRRQSTNNMLARAQRFSRGSLIPSVNRRSGDELRQSRLLLGNGPTASQGRRRSDQVWYGNGLLNRRNPPMSNSRDDSDAHLKEIPGESSSQAYAQYWLSDQAPHNHQAPREGTKDSERCQPQSNKPWSHTLQVLLQRTPPPQATWSDEEAGGGYSPAPLDHIHDQHKEGVESRSFKRQRRCSSVSTSESAGLDSRRLLMKRERIRANGGGLKRIASTKLPLETISQTDSTLNLSVKIEVQIGELQAATLEFMNSGLATKPGLALQFRNMDEVEEVDRRLRQVTESWLKGNPSITVEFTFRSEVKGKSKA
ncbi:DNA mismatch repair PMS2 [Fusarium subglutinans]|uniref:DNA mismatch repair PMS2 n=1 Tax=Gibberella subglutinans TaxID=42677 RepID=A0A8H5KJN3_GIBSU|nr:DNA mismatch repair PMS2 [Fusarium subglutinans]KAF5575067.1 DNA mismatch repair PMS2 [Fusarium subglutinans]